MKLAITMVAFAVCLPCLAQEDEGPPPEDMCRSHIGWVPCSEDTPITHACFDRSDPINCLDCVLVLAGLGIIDGNHDNVANTIAGCLAQSFPAEAWSGLEEREGSFTDSVGVTHSEKATHQFIIDGIYIARLGASNLMCRNSDESAPPEIAGLFQEWNRDEARDPGPVTARMAEKAMAEQPEAQVVVIFSECSGFHPRAGPHIYFQPADETGTAYHDAVFAIMDQGAYTAVAVPRNSLEADVFDYAGWKARPIKKDDKFVVFIPPLREYQFL